MKRGRSPRRPLPGRAPASLLSAVRDPLRPRARFAAQSFRTLGWTRVPECCAPISPIGDLSVAEQSAMIRDMPPAALTSELEVVSNGSHPWPSQWRVAADQPRR